MNFSAVYYTRTGASKRVAEKLAGRLSCQAVQIKETLNWKGVLGFFVGGYYASNDKNTNEKIHKDLDAADELIVVTPLWGSGVAPALKTLLKTTPVNKIHLVVTSIGSTIRNRLGYKSVNDIVKNQCNEDAMIDELSKSLSYDHDSGRLTS